MNNGLFIAAIVIFIFFILIGLLLFKEVRTHLFWRRLVSEGDFDAINGILLGEIDRWRTQRPPKGTSAAVWAGVQSMELLAGSSQFVHISTTAEAEFRVVEGKRVQVATAYDTAVSTVSKLTEMLLYDVPNLRPDFIRVDAYTTFRDADGSATAQPILSSLADRQRAAPVDWDWGDPHQIVAAFDLVTRISDAGEALPVELPPVPAELAATLAAAEAAEAAEPAEAAEAADPPASSDASTPHSPTGP